MSQPVTVGVVADTHIPDRVRGLHPRILPLLREAGVVHILHAGDISSPGVLKELASAAPVTAVRGNRDFMAGSLKAVERLAFAGVPLALLHGHGSLFHYLWDKFYFWKDGYVLDRYLHLLSSTAGPAKVVVFGHTHHREATYIGGRLLFNPGSASFGDFPGHGPAIGLLRFFPDGRVEARIIPLEGYIIRDRGWVANDGTEARAENCQR